MKRNIFLNSSLFLLLSFSLLLPSCSEDLQGNAPASSGQSLRIHVDDSGYTATSQTRAQEKDYQTLFTAGNKIGVFAVKEGAIVSGINNLCLTATASSSGELTWAQAAGSNVQLFVDATYYAYYPWQENLTGELDPAADNADAFFANVITKWTPASDQSDYAKYTVQDLMIAQGTLSGKSLSFSMAHQMSLVVIDLPKANLKLSNDESYTWISDIPDMKLEFNPYRMSDGTYRYLVKPSASNGLTGSYINGNNVKVTWTVTPSASAGMYKTYKVDGGSSTRIEKSHILQVGDFYCKNASGEGYLIPKDIASLTDEQQKDCVGVVYWLGDINSYNYGLLDSKFPSGTHGLVVSLWDMPSPDDNNNFKMKWTYDDYESVNNWLGSAIWSGKVGRPGNFTSIQAQDKMQGYANTVALEEYNKYIENPGNSKNQDLRVKPVKGLSAFQDAHPAPENSSGWYWPSLCELQYVCWGQGNGQSISGKYLLETQFGKVGGTSFGDNNYYLSSTEVSDLDVNSVYFNNGRVVKTFKHVGADYVRPLLAF